MNRKSFLVLFTALFLMTINVAQAQRGGGLQRLEINEELQTALSLTDQQVEQLEALKAKSLERAQAIRGHEDADPQTRHDHARASRKEMRGELEEILSPEQITQLKIYLQEKAEQRRALMEQVDREGMRAEIKAYREAHVKPVMSELHAKLSGVLSAEDKAQLISWQETIQAEREKRKVERQAIKETRPADAPQLKATPDPEKRPYRRGRILDQLPEIKAGLEAMVAKYDTQITPLLASIQPQTQQWKADIKAIRDKYIPEELRRERPNHQLDEAKRELQRKMKFLLRSAK